ncbi:MAG: Gldg family protein [Myxococcota bacterium]
MAGLTRLHSLWPLLVSGGGLFLFFLGEQGLGDDPQLRPSVSGLGAAAVLAGLLGRILEPNRDPEAGVRGRLISLHTGLVLGLAIYGLSTLLEGVGQTVCFTLALVITSMCALPLLLVEMALAPVAYNAEYERARFRQAWTRGLGFGLLVPCIALANLLAETHDLELPLARGAQTRPSEATVAAVQELTEPLEVRLFFPRANQVADLLQTYFSPLEAANELLSVRVMDHAIEREAARAVSVGKNGWVAVVRGDVSEKLRVGVERRGARSRLRRFDRDFLEAFVKVGSQRKRAYFTVGHGERPFERSAKDGEPSAVRFLAKNLEKLQYELKPLGLADGLDDGVPEDAEILFIMGPETPLLSQEQEAILDSLRKGARVFMALEPGAKSPAETLLAGAGLRFDPQPLANPRVHVALTKSRRDHLALASNAYQPSPITRNLMRDGRVATVFYEAGGLQLEPGEEDVDTRRAIASMPGTYQDADGDLELDEGEAKANGYLLAATARFTSTSTTADEDAEGRLVVLADVDAAADEFVQLVQGNLSMLRDSVLWLQRAEDPVVTINEEEDVKIVHRKDEDLAIFYGTTFGLPGLVLLVGFVVKRRRRS